MVMDALRGYLQLASGLTEVTKQRAQQAAKQLLQQTGADSLTTGLTGKVGDLADEIVATSKSNRALLQAIVANEVEGAVAKLGFVRAEEVAALRRRIDRLERDEAATTESGVQASVAGVGGGSTAKKAPAKKAPAKKVAAKKVAAKKAPADKAVAKKAAVKKTTEKSASEAIKAVAAELPDASAEPAGPAGSAALKTTPSTPLGSASSPAKKAAKKTAKKSAKKA